MREKRIISNEKQKSSKIMSETILLVDAKNSGGLRRTGSRDRSIHNINAEMVKNT